MDARPTLRVRLLDGESEALLLTREGRWKLCRVEAEMMPPEWAPTTVRLILAGEGYAPGCSGSPILTYTDGDAVGLISIGGGTIDKETGRRLPDIVGAPMLATRLPAWFVADIRAAEMF
jgi:hypothetical protein